MPCVFPYKALVLSKDATTLLLPTRSKFTNAWRWCWWFTFLGFLRLGLPAALALGVVLCPACFLLDDRTCIHGTDHHLGTDTQRGNQLFNIVTVGQAIQDHGRHIVSSVLPSHELGVLDDEAGPKLGLVTIVLQCHRRCGHLITIMTFGEGVRGIILYSLLQIQRRQVTIIILRFERRQFPPLLVQILFRLAFHLAREAGKLVGERAQRQPRHEGEVQNAQERSRDLR